jgi:hypothetical protein
MRRSSAIRWKTIWVRGEAFIALAAMSLLAASAAAVRAQQQSTTPTLSTGVMYSDQYSQTCDEQNASNPFAGMNPLVCHGEVAPQASNGQCNLAGMQLLKHVGETCYYCSPINPPLKGIVIPMDQVGIAEKQNWDCGLDQADACMAVCQGGGQPYIPPAGTTGGTGVTLPAGTQQNQGPTQTGGIEQTPTPGPAGGIGYVPGVNPCQPQGQGGYDYCQNGPGARLPAGCVCQATTLKTSTSSEYGPCQPAPADEPAAAPSYRFQAGFQAGMKACAVTPTVIGDVAAAEFGNAQSYIPSLLQISTSPQTLESVMRPAGTSANSDPYLEGETEGGRLCAWLLANQSGKIGECPGTTPPAQTQNKPVTKPQTNPIADAAQYLSGAVDGFGVCFKGIGSLIAGAGFFGHGDFVNAAKAWGLSPGQSVVLKAMYTEMTTPQINVVSNVTPYQSGLTAGRRLCQYGAIPGATQAAGTAIKGAILPGSTFTNPIKGTALQTAINTAPKTLAKNWVLTGKGPMQLGAYVGEGSFASVFKYGTKQVIKLSKNGPETLGYGQQSIGGQQAGAAILGSLQVATPKIASNLSSAGGNGIPASLVADDVAAAFPKSFQLTSQVFQKMAQAEQQQVLAAIKAVSDRIAGGGFGWLDINPGNITLQPIQDGFNVIIHDPDMIGPVSQFYNLQAGTAPQGVLLFGLQEGGGLSLFGQQFSAQQLMDLLQNGRIQRLMGASEPSVPAQVNTPSGTVANP